MKQFAIHWTRLSVGEGKKWEIQGKGIREHRSAERHQRSSSSTLSIHRLEMIPGNTTASEDVECQRL